MKNYKMIIQYEGSRYQGWQRQDKTENTIQGKIENVLTKMTEVSIEITGSGRTDSGVHALGQVANVHLETEKSCEEIQAYLNQYLPEDIGIISVEEVEERFHSRLRAKNKTYLYRVRNSEVPAVFDRRYVYVMPEILDIKAMQEAAKYLQGTHDFKAFCTKKKMKKSTVRTIHSIRIEHIGDEIRFFYNGNGFLYHMVRIMTGTLLEVGKGKRKPDEVRAILESGLRENAGELVPGIGLTLMEVAYK